MSSLLELLKDHVASNKKKGGIAGHVTLVSILVVVINSAFDLGEKGEELYRWAGWDMCHMRDPATGKVDRSSAPRKCMDGDITFIKWSYPFDERDEQQGIFRPAMPGNRVLQVVSIDGSQVSWIEQKLQVKQNGKQVWDRVPKVVWYSIQGGQKFPGPQLINDDAQVPIPSIGFVLRRFDVTSKKCGTDALELRDAPPEHTNEILERNRHQGVQVMELLIPADASDVLAAKETPWLFTRWIGFNCDKEIGNSFKFGPLFTHFDQIDTVIKD